MCKYSTKQKQNFYEHKNLHTGERPYTCSKCNFSFKYQRNLRSHLKHKEKNIFKCDRCDYVTDVKRYFSRHYLKVHVGEKRFKCDICDYAAYHRYEVTRHSVIHKGDRPEDVLPSDAGKKRKCRSLYANKYSETQKRGKILSCSKCEYTTRCYSNLKVHEAVHSDVKPYQCLKCDYSSRFSSNLYSHERKYHNLNRKFQKKKQTNVSLNNTFISETSQNNRFDGILPSGNGKKRTLNWLHNNKCNKTKIKTYKKFLCSICGYPASSLTKLKIHVAIHSDEKPYQCSKCGYSSRFLCNLNSHKRKYHNEGKQRLSKKKKSFTTQEKCSSSVVLDNVECQEYEHDFEEKNHKCIHCGDSFSDLKLFRAHKETSECKGSEDLEVKSSLSESQKESYSKVMEVASVCDGKLSQFIKDYKPNIRLKSSKSICKKQFEFSSNLDYLKANPVEVKTTEDLQVLQKSSEFDTLDSNVALQDDFHSEFPQGNKFEDILSSNAGKNRNLHDNKSNELKKRGKKYSCSKCEYTAQKYAYLKSHEATHSDEKPYQCSKCAYSSRFLSNLNSHKRKYHNEGKERLSKKKKSFTTQEKCSSSVVLDNVECQEYEHDFEEKNHKCIHCGDLFSDLKLFRAHKETSECKGSEDLEVKSSLSENQKESYSKVKEVASVCGGKLSQSIEDYKPNIRLKSSKSIVKKQFHCKICDYSTNNKIHIADHKFSHTGERPYMCLKCNFSFRYRSNLSRHRKICFGIKNSGGKLRTKRKSKITNRISSDEDETEFLGFSTNLSHNNNCHTKLEKFSSQDCTEEEKFSSQDYIEEEPLYIKGKQEDLYEDSAEKNVLETVETTSENFSSDLDYLKANPVKVNTTEDLQILQKSSEFDTLDSNAALQKDFHSDFPQGNKFEDILSSNAGKNRNLHDNKSNELKKLGQKFSCSKCEYTAPKYAYLKSHEATHSDEKPYQCSKCDYSSRFSSNLYSHKRKHHNELRRSLVIQRKSKELFTTQKKCSPKTVLVNVEGHEYELDSDEIAHKCIHCGDSFPSLKLSKAHHETTSKCKGNGEFFVKPLLSTNQKEPHSTDKEVVSACDTKNSHTTDDYKSNMGSRKIVDKKRFHCKMCCYSTNKKDHFVDHEISHTGERPYTCLKCNFSFKYRSNLSRHKKICFGSKNSGGKLKKKTKSKFTSSSTGESEFLGFDNILSHNICSEQTKSFTSQDCFGEALLDIKVEKEDLHDDSIEKDVLETKETTSENSCWNLDIKVEKEDLHDDSIEKDVLETKETTSENSCWNLDYSKIRSVKVETTEDLQVEEKSCEFDVLDSNVTLNNGFNVHISKGDKFENILPSDVGKKEKK
ncbi:Zinc finger protein [Armadillidium vulgare]|nr:Zinc finger protein [Armadillidium vulgare]